MGTYCPYHVTPLLARVGGPSTSSRLRLAVCVVFEAARPARPARRRTTVFAMTGAQRPNLRWEQQTGVQRGRGRRGWRHPWQGRRTGNVPPFRSGSVDARRGRACSSLRSSAAVDGAHPDGRQRVDQRSLVVEGRYVYGGEVVDPFAQPGQRCREVVGVDVGATRPPRWSARIFSVVAVV